MFYVCFTLARSKNSDSCVANIALFNVINHPILCAHPSTIVSDILSQSGNDIRNVRMCARSSLRLRRVSGDLYPANQGEDKDKREGNDTFHFFTSVVLLIVFRTSDQPGVWRLISQPNSDDLSRGLYHRRSRFVVLALYYILFFSVCQLTYHLMSVLFFCVLLP